MLVQWKQLPRSKRTVILHRIFSMMLVFDTDAGGFGVKRRGIQVGTDTIIVGSR